MSRGQINAVPNRLVREGAITGFKTTFGVRDYADAPPTTVTAAVLSARALNDVRVIEGAALATVAEGVAITAERKSPSKLTPQRGCTQSTMISACGAVWWGAARPPST